MAASVVAAGCVAPELVDVEVAHVLRRLVRRGDLAVGEGETAVGSLMQLGVARRSHRPFLPRIWRLRDNLTAYDAAYMALAEALRCPLVTADARLASASGVRCEIVVLDA